jgi:DNA polymerase-3 subunit alpha|tara:strand:+ start:27655 stop:32013 length:4359 start_codon:yes stop_codon:yes gene_type:complete
MYIIFDTETTGLPRDWNAPISDVDNWPRAVQIAWQVHDDLGHLVEHKDFLIQPEGYDIPYDAERIHGISTALAEKEGVSLESVLEEFEKALGKAKFVVGQNLKFDLNIMGAEMIRKGFSSRMLDMPVLDTCTEVTAQMCQIPGGRGGKWKLPTLTELHKYLFEIPFNEAHNATADVEATTRCFFELIRREVFTAEELEVEAPYFNDFKIAHPDVINPYGLKHINLKEASEAIKTVSSEPSLTSSDKEEARAKLAAAPFVHLHNHTQFSILQSTTSVRNLIKHATDSKMKAVALTDTGNMMAAFHFEKAANIHNKSVKAGREKAEEEGTEFDGDEILPIIGCEFNVCADHSDKKNKDNGSAIVLIAKNKNGYQNLIKLSSYAFTQGFYYVPRIDKKLIEEYKEDLICLTGNLYGEVPNMILNLGESQAEEALLYWKDLFKDDLYLEIMRHGQEDEERVNEVLIRFSEKHEVKLVATNNTYYLDKSDAESHDILLCLKDNELVSTPIGRGRGFRYGLPNQEYYFKSEEEMKELFLDLPEAIFTIEEILNKIEPYQLARDVLLPAFDIPSEFTDPLDAADGGKRGENNYLRHLTYEGAKDRYEEITDEIRDRIDFELATVEKTGYPGYFLIVQDFCHAAREMGVWVGPGRGSAAGSVVAYCNGITNIDPIKYDLLFERFLNPDRVSMPDIDIDFDDEGRGKVIEYVINKYGANQVAQIITYGTMAAKSSLRDTSRVLDLPLSEASQLSNRVTSLSLKKMFSFSDAELADALKNQEDFTKAKELRDISQSNAPAAKVVQKAADVEGCVRNTGIHACGVIITPGDITNYVPVALAKDSEMFCTQYDNSVAEEAGLLKMDFLGLSTLTLIKHAVRNIKEIRGIEIDVEKIPLDDLKTYELFQRGETVGIFQYESPGMQKHMRDLKPTVFGDLIAMNALYRPGPMEYIPSFIKRKHGEEEIKYDLDDCEEYLKETYGITVYQEQVMLLSQKLAGFTKGEADTLRKAMGKKQIDVLNKMKPLFIKNGGEKGHNATALEKIWKDWEAFAAYAFNKSHSTCYAWIAYQTAYLKANYPAEYMASVLSNNMNDIKKVSFFMEECRRMELPVLGPDVNESTLQFTVNKEGALRFGLGAIKGLGNGPVGAIIEERQENGPYKGIFEFTGRVNLRLVNKKAMESLAYAGGFDSFKGIHRAQYFFPDNNGRTFLENAVRFGANLQENENSSQVSMFGEASGTKIPEPEVPKADEWNSTYKLNREKEVVGIFISGHPLDDFRMEIEAFCKGSVSQLKNLEENKGLEVTVACVVTLAEHRLTKNGDPFGKLFIEDYTDSHELFFWRENYLKFKHFHADGAFLAISGRIEIPHRRNNLEFVVHNIELLHEIKEKKVKAIHLKVNAKDMDQVMISDLMKVCLENEGICPLNFSLYDESTNVVIKMPSKNVKVDPSKAFFKKLKQFNLEFELV